MDFSGLKRLCDGLYINFDSRELVYKDINGNEADKKKGLTVPEFTILRYLCENSGKLCHNKDMIAEVKATGIDFFYNEDIIDNIYSIRGIITGLTGNKELSKELIENRRGQGYILKVKDVSSQSLGRIAVNPGDNSKMKLEFLTSMREEQNGNYTKAFNMNKELANQGYLPSINCIGVMYMKGTGVERNTEMGIKCYRYAAERGYSVAQLNLADCYMDAMLGHYDPEKAVMYYTLAATNEHEPDGDAMYRLYQCYSTGVGCEKNEAKALEWKKRAAELGVEKYKNYYIN